MRVAKIALAGLPAFELALHERPDAYVSGLIRNHGVYEPFETEVFRSAIRPGDVVVDAGANIGWYTVVGALCTGPRGKVFAFEPQKDNFALLAANVERNHLGWARAEPLALGDVTGDALLHLSTENLADHRLYESDEARETESVRAITLDEYFRASGGAPDVFKMDTQGFELRILAGARASLGRGTTVVLLEYWPYAYQQAGGQPGELADRLEELGGELYVIDERRSCLHPVTPAVLREQERGQLHPRERGFVNILRWPAARPLPAALQARIYR